MERDVLTVFYVKSRSDVSGSLMAWLSAGSSRFPESLFPELRKPGSTSALSLSNADPQTPEPGDVLGDAVPQGVPV